MTISLISTIFDLKSLLLAVDKFEPETIVLLTDNKNYPEIKDIMEELYKKRGRHLKIKIKEISNKDILTIASQTFNIISTEIKEKNDVIVHLIENNSIESIALSYASCSFIKDIYKLTILDPKNEEIVDLPIFDYNISKNKVKILLYINEGADNVKDISEKTELSSSMVYNHIKDLRHSGYINPKELVLTTAGKMAILKFQSIEL
ncbi:ArsR family transcriptional regulator [uncultured Methanobrevibacter sp.]|uniref:ArsR family transcriptional regulator n=1 Tax=uncultured Methanobrevibacter sp. TaxID=253161 RepID=UPI0025DA932E|nr:ArsR family transcriptional regulator [uncultured Methanobrevibacter sp.]